MTKTFATIGKTSTEAVDNNQPVWVLVPETVQSAVVSTYSRQLHAGVKVLVRLGSAGNIVDAQSRTPSRQDGAASYDATGELTAALRRQIDAMAGNPCKRTQLFISRLSALRLIRPPLYPVMEKLRALAPLTSKDLTPLINILCAALRRNAAVPSGYQRKLRNYIQTGAYDGEFMLWLALCADPIFALQLWHDSLASQLPRSTEKIPAPDRSTRARSLLRTVDHLRAGLPCYNEACSTDDHAWLADLVGCEPQARFFAAVEDIHQGINRNGCLVFDRSKSFNYFGESAPRFLTLDKLSRTITALDRALSHLTVVFADDDDEMRRLCDGHLVHSGLLIRGLVGECEAIKTLYPWHAVAIPNRAELSQALIGKVRAAYHDGSLARVGAGHYGLSADHMAKGIGRAIAVLQRLMPLVPIEVHRLADAIETRVRLGKIAEKLHGSSDRQQAAVIEVAIQAQAQRQQQLGKTLKADFRVDPSRLFYIDDLLIERIKALFGGELAVLRTVLAPYIERHKAAKQAKATQANSGLAIKS